MIRIHFQPFQGRGQGGLEIQGDALEEGQVEKTVGVQGRAIS
jgi:hypothetical protein